MGYYCTVPQCTSLAGKTKNVKFHRFPRDDTMAVKWNVILKRGKPYTKYSKVCSLHFTQSDYNVTTMGQWKTLSKDAVPSQNLPRLNPDGSVMVIRKSRTVKYRETSIKKEVDTSSDAPQDKWPQTPSSILQSVLAPNHSPQGHRPLATCHSPQRALVPCPSPQHTHVNMAPTTAQRAEEANLAYRLQTMNALANSLTNPVPSHTTATPHPKPKKQDAIMQTDPCSEEDEKHASTAFSDQSDSSFQSENTYPNMTLPGNSYLKDEYEGQVNRSSQIGHSQRDGQMQTPMHQMASGLRDGPNRQDQSPGQSLGQSDGSSQMQDNYEIPKDYTKSNEEFSHAMESVDKYGGLDRKYEKPMEGNYQQKMQYNKVQDLYPGDFNRDFQEKPNEYSGRNDYNSYLNGYSDTIDILRNQQHNIQMLQEQHRPSENQNFFTEGHIKQEADLNEEDKYIYEQGKEMADGSMYEGQRRHLMQQRMLEHLQPQVKSEPDPLGGCDPTLTAADSPYYQNGHNNIGMGYYEQFAKQPGPELLIAKQNALAAHTQLWHNTMRRPFFYSEPVHATGSQLLHRYEDLTRILQ